MTYQDAADHLDAERGEHLAAIPNPFERLADNGHERAAYVLALAFSCAAETMEVLCGALRMAQRLEPKGPRYTTMAFGLTFGRWMDADGIAQSALPELQELADAYLQRLEP